MPDQRSPAQVLSKRRPLPDRKDASLGARVFYGGCDITHGKDVVGAAGALQILVDADEAQIVCMTELNNFHPALQHLKDTVSNFCSRMTMVLSSGCRRRLCTDKRNMACEQWACLHVCTRLLHKSKRSAHQWAGPCVPPRLRDSPVCTTGKHRTPLMCRRPAPAPLHAPGKHSRLSVF